MSVLATILGGRGADTLAAPAEQRILEVLLGASRTSKAGVVVTEMDALRVSAVAGCLRAVSQDVAQLPLKLMQEREDGTKLPAKKHRVYRIVHDRPNAWQTSMGLRAQLTGHAVLGKGGYALVTRVNGVVQEVLPAPYNAIRVQQDSNWGVRYFARAAGGKEFEVPGSDLLRIQGWSWTGLEGFPAIEQARDVLGLAMAMEEAQSGLHKNGTRPAGLLSTDASFAGKPEMANRIRENWLKAYGAGGPGGVAVVDAGMKFVPITMSGADAETLDSRKFQIEEVCRILGVPPTRIGYSDKASTYASAAQFAQDYVKFTLAWWLGNWEQALSMALLTEEEIADGFIFRHEMGGLLEGTPDIQANVFKAALGTSSSPGWMSVNDVRRKLDLNPLSQPGADLVVTLKEFAGAQSSPKPAPKSDDDGPPSEV